MSKTYLDQIEKAKMLVEGLKKNYEQVKGYGVRQEELTELEVVIAEGEKLNAEVERLRAETSEMVANANGKLAEVKAKMAEWKHMVKLNFNIEQWQNFGVMDKR